MSSSVDVVHVFVVPVVPVVPGRARALFGEAISKGHWGYVRAVIAIPAAIIITIITAK